MGKRFFLVVFLIAGLTLSAARAASPFNIYLSTGNLSYPDLKANVVNRGVYPLGTLQSRIPYFIESTDDIFCPQSSSTLQRLPANASQEFVFFAETVTTCDSLPRPLFVTQPNASMTFVVIKAPEDGIEKLSWFIRQNYDLTLATYSRKFNVGFVVVDSKSFDNLKRVYGKDPKAFTAVMDFRVTPLAHDSNHRQILLWLDPNKIKHYETLFMVQTLANLINNEVANNASVTFRPFYNMYRNPKLVNIALREDIAANLYCSDRYSNFCLDRRSYGNLSNLETMVDEIVRQSILFKNDGDLFKRYINEYTVSCLIDNVMMTNMTKCTEGVTKFLSEVVDTDIGRTLMNNNSVVHKTVLETNMASIEKYRSDPSEFQISVNNQFVKGEFTGERLLALICTGLSPVPDSCQPKILNSINKVTSSAFISRFEYEYENFSVYLTLLLTLIFLVYILGLMIVQFIFSNRPIPSYIPMSVILN